MWFKLSHTFLLLKTIIMSQKTITIITLLVSIGISFVGYLISVVAFPFAASLIDWSPFYLTLCFGIPSFLLIWICTFIITKKKALRAAVLLPLLVSIVGSIGTSGGRFWACKYRHGYIQVEGNLDEVAGEFYLYPIRWGISLLYINGCEINYENIEWLYRSPKWGKTLYNNFGLKIIDSTGYSDYYFASSPHGEIIVDFSYEEVADDVLGDDYNYETEYKDLWVGTANIYTLNGGYLGEKTWGKWIEKPRVSDDGGKYWRDEKGELLVELKEKHNIDCHTPI